MMARVREREPDARLEGALVARMIEGGVETVIGIKRDPVFGPVVMFGLGGVYVEVLKDVTLRLAPVDRASASEMIRAHQGLSAARRRARQAAGRSRWRSPTRSWRCRASAPRMRVASAEINPFIALPEGGVAVDALILTDRRNAIMNSKRFASTWPTTSRPSRSTGRRSMRRTGNRARRSSICSTRSATATTCAA